jgi:Zn-dependent M28 family amino/carboxypeptidase
MNFCKQLLSAGFCVSSLVGHLQAFQKQADENKDLPGTRFAGTAGYDASRDYVVDKMTLAGYKVTLQDVPLEITYISLPRVFEQTKPIAKKYADNVDYIPFIGSGAGDISGDVQTPGDVAGCSMADFKGFSAGNVALVQRGTCAIRVKVNNAIQSGAKAVIVYNNTPGTLFAGLGSPIPSETTPIIFATPELGAELKSAMQNGELPSVHIKFNLIKKSGVSHNIIAESVGGNPDHVVMVGAHLDSAAGNSGMNDNGSAAATVLETALLMQKVKPVNKLRFAWWTGEELGMLGSNYYVANLNAAEKAKIKVYLNYEILGAPNGGRFIMGTADGITPAGSEKITKLYENYFKSAKLKYFTFDPRMGDAGIRSDMYAFMQAGIPSGYIVTGADLVWNDYFDTIFTDLSKRTVGKSSHPCYHQACDTLNDANFDYDLYLQMSKAAAYAIYSYSMDID